MLIAFFVFCAGALSSRGLTPATLRWPTLSSLRVKRVWKLQGKCIIQLTKALFPPKAKRGLSERSNARVSCRRHA